jgi:hypothetical protein
MSKESNRQHPRNERVPGNNDRSGRDENTDDEFPGYPHYPAKEDIMSPTSDMERIEVDVENLSPSGKYVDASNNLNTMSHPPASEAGALDDEEDDLSMVPGTEADVTRDELIVLGGPRFSADDLHGSAMNTRVNADDLDIPGAELDNENEDIGEEDEENNYYSLGGDRHEDLEEDREG